MGEDYIEPLMVRKRRSICKWNRREKGEVKSNNIQDEMRERVHRGGREGRRG